LAQKIIADFYAAGSIDQAARYMFCVTNIFTLTSGRELVVFMDELLACKPVKEGKSCLNIVITSSLRTPFVKFECPKMGEIPLILILLL
jgi:hypothetical protein